MLVRIDFSRIKPLTFTILHNLIVNKLKAVEKERPTDPADMPPMTWWQPPPGEGQSPADDRSATQNLLREQVVEMLTPLELSALLAYLISEGDRKHARYLYGTDGSDLRLMPSVDNLSDIPETGKSLIIVAVVEHVLHFRILGLAGKVEKDTDENSLPDQARLIEDLREQLGLLWPPHELTKSEKDRVIAAVTSIVRHTGSSGYDGSLNRAKEKLRDALRQNPYFADHVKALFEDCTRFYQLLIEAMAK